MKYAVLILLCLALLPLLATQVSLSQADSFAQTALHALYPGHQVSVTEELRGEDDLLAYVMHLDPLGYLVIGAHSELPPLLAYSGTSSFHGGNGLLAELIRADLSQRLQNADYRYQSSVTWQDDSALFRFEQWPPVGYSTTEGWVTTRWNQTYPYNTLCPLDPQNNGRSLAGCPAVAMAQILNFHATLNGTRLDDDDDYYHSYAGRNYWIDNDHATLDFPSFPALNVILDEVTDSFRYGQPITDVMKAALIFASGTTLKQVYTSGGSGTFSVNQAFTAYQRFNFAQSVLLNATAPDLDERMSDNIKAALPIHFAVVTPAWDAGHNVVLDGYNTNGFYHVNFGWGGAQDGWYLLPQGMPYNLTVIEGVVLDIIPHQYVFVMPDTLNFTQAPVQTLEIVNLHNGEVTVQELRLSDAMNIEDWTLTPSAILPHIIPENGWMTWEINYNGSDRPETVHTQMRLILDQIGVSIPLVYSSGTSVTDEVILPPAVSLNAFPNPFSYQTTIRYTLPDVLTAEIDIYNLRGQKVRSLKSEEAVGNNAVFWDGRGEDGTHLANGIYFAVLANSRTRQSIKLLLLR